MLPEFIVDVYELENMETNYIHTVIEHCEGDTVKAAKALGISRATLYRKLKKMKEK